MTDPCRAALQELVAAWDDWLLHGIEQERQANAFDAKMSAARAALAQPVVPPSPD
jgi:hypothetical protein